MLSSLRTQAGQTAWLQVSCTEWKNLFSFEIYGRVGKLAIDGLGGSYGTERLTHYRMLPEMGPPETTSWEFPKGDDVLGPGNHGLLRGHPPRPDARAGPQRRHPDPRDRGGHLPEKRLPLFLMIITRSPLRVSLGGGGTDLPSYYKEHGGFLIAAAIDKYVYITKHTTFQEEIIVKYSKLERVASVDKIEHPIVREALKLVGVTDPHIELTSMADIPGGTGLGSSGSFTTALLKALHAYKKNLVSPAELAEQACDIEINKLGEPIGKQDQYIAAIGGITAFTFHKDGRVEYRPCKISEETLYNLEDNLLLFFTGYSRSASSILKDQNDRSKKNDARCWRTCTSRRSLATSRSPASRAATSRSSPC
jgi:hypothetical protein